MKSNSPGQNQPSRLFQTLGRYRLLILLLAAFTLRLSGISSPLLGVHSWRQTDTAAIARNYYQNGYRLLYPQVDWRGDTDGYAETEFQIYPYIVSLLYGVFAPDEVLGRLVSILLFIGSVVFLYLLVRAVMDRNAAFFAALFYAFLPTNVYYSRSFMPESAMLMFSVAGIYLFYIWLEREKLVHFLLSALMISLAVLVKLPALYLGLPLLYLAWHKYKSRALLRWPLWLYAILVLAPVVLWYYHAHQLYKQTHLTFKIWEYGTEKWGSWSFALSFDYWSALLVRLHQLHFAYYAIAAFLIGILLKRKARQERLFDFWLLAVICYFLIVPHGNIWHEYYQLPLMLPASVFIGKLFGRFFCCRRLTGHEKMGGKTLILGIVLLLTMFESLQIYTTHLKAEREEGNWYVDLPNALDKISDKDDLVVAASNGNPKILYYARRKGWICRPGELSSAYILDKIARGAKCFIGFNSRFAAPAARTRLQELLNEYRLVYEGQTTFIIDLRRVTVGWPSLPRPR